MIFYIPLIVLLSLVILFGTFFVVKQQSAAVVERFGKFTSIRQSGLQLKIPIIDRVAGRLSLRIQQLDVVVETKTKDDESKKLGPYRKEGYWQEKGQFYDESEPPPECPFHKGDKDVS